MQKLLVVSLLVHVLRIGIYIQNAGVEAFPYLRPGPNGARRGE